MSPNGNGKTLILLFPESNWNLAQPTTLPEGSTTHYEDICLNFSTIISFNFIIFLDAVKTGLSRRLFPKEQLISGKDDASNNFARGYYTSGRKIIHQIIEALRKLTEDCDCLQVPLKHQ